MPAESRPLPRIFVTGAGIVSPLGLDWAQNEASFRSHHTSFRPVTLFDVSQRIARTAASVDLPSERQFLKIPARRQHLIDRGTHMLMLAIRECLAMAKMKGMQGIDALIIGTSAGAMGVGQEYFRHACASPGRVTGQLSRLEFYQPHRQLNAIAEEFGWHGPIIVVSNACASGANAIGDAMAMIQTGKARRVLAGGYDAIAELVYSGFDTLRALAPSGIPRPFDAARDGLALGEGAGMVLLESEEAAAERGAAAEVIATAAGYATATDLHHLTQPDPEGKAAIRTMTGACTMARLTPDQVDYINSHGTGTPFNDVAEAAAIRAWAGSEATAARIAVSSTKSAMGHLLGGAGAVEAVICLMALRGQWLPASLHVREVDPAVGFDLVQTFREAPVNVVLTNSFGFGGTNATLVFAKNGNDHSKQDDIPSKLKFEVKKASLMITGVGAVTSAGWGAPALLAACSSPAATDSPASSLPESLPLAEVSRTIGPRDWSCLGYQVPPVTADRLPKFPRLRRASAITKFSIAAALEALGQPPSSGPSAANDRLGIIQLVFNGCVQFSGKFYQEVMETPALASPLIFPETVYNAPASHIAAYLGCDGPVSTLIGDSSSIMEAVCMAHTWLLQGLVDRVLVIGAEESHWLSAEAASYYHPNLHASEGAGAVLLTLAETGEPPEPGSLTLTATPAQAFHNETEHRAALDQVLSQPSAASTLITGLSGLPVLDAAETSAYCTTGFSRNAKSGDAPSPSFLHPRQILGESMGAAGALQLALAAAFAREQGPGAKVQIILPGTLAAAYGAVVEVD